MRKIMIDKNIYALFKRTKIYNDLNHLASTGSNSLSVIYSFIFLC